MAMMIDIVYKEKQNTYVARIAAFHYFDWSLLKKKLLDIAFAKRQRATIQSKY